MTAPDEQARLAVEDLADLMSVARQRTADRALHAAIRRMAERHDHGPQPSAVRLSTAAELLGVSVPTVRSWMAHGVLDEVPGKGVARVAATSLARALAVVRALEEGEPGRRRLARVIDALRDRDLLERARDAATGTSEFVEYDDADLQDLLNP